MQIPPYIKVVTFSDYVVLHNLKSGGWVKITREYYEQLASYLSTNELSEFKSQLDDFDEFVEYLIRNEYLYNEETVCCGDEPGPGIRHGDIKLVYLHLCDACNLRCRTCYFSPSDSPTYLSTEVAKRTVRLLAMGGTKAVVLSGGEPLLHPDVEQVARSAKEAGMNVGIITNGTLLDRDIAARLMGYVDYIQISIDGLQDQHDRIRGPGSYRAALTGARRAREAVMQNVILTTTVTRLNVDSWRDIRENTHNMGFSQSFSLFMPTGVGKINAHELMPSPEQLLPFVLGLLTCDDGKELPEPISLISRCSCGAGVHLISIDPDGSIYPCHLIRAPELKMGSVVTTEHSLLEDISKSRVFKRLRSCNVDSNRKCSLCQVRYFCAGGCSANGILNGLDVDPHCTWYKPLYSAAIECMDKSRKGAEILALMKEYLKSERWKRDERSRDVACLQEVQNPRC